MEYFSKNLTFLRKKSNLKQYEVAQQMGFNGHSRLSNYENGISNPELSVLLGFSKLFEVSIDDLVSKDLEKSNSLTSKKKPDLVSEPAEKYGKQEGLPLIPIDAAAGFANGDISVLKLDVDRYIVPDFNNKADYLIRIAGTSMSPKYYNGDVVACRKIPKETFIQWGKVYVMDTVQGALCKRLFESKTEGFVSVVSENDKYPAFEMSKKEIRSLAIVVGVIRLE